MLVLFEIMIYMSELRKRYFVSLTRLIKGREDQIERRGGSSKSR